MHRVKANGKVYEYDKTTVLIDRDVYDFAKEQAKEEGRTLKGHVQHLIMREQKNKKRRK